MCCGRELTAELRTFVCARVGNPSPRVMTQRENRAGGPGSRWRVLIPARLRLWSSSTRSTGTACRAHARTRATGLSSPPARPPRAVTVPVPAPHCGLCSATPGGRSVQIRVARIVKRSLFALSRVALCTRLQHAQGVPRLRAARQLRRMLGSDWVQAPRHNKRDIACLIFSPLSDPQVESESRRNVTCS